MMISDMMCEISAMRAVTGCRDAHQTDALDRDSLLGVCYSVSVTGWLINV